MSDRFADAALHPGMMRKLKRRTVSKGEISLPAVPGLLEEYVQMCNDIFTALGVTFTAEDLNSLREVLDIQLNAAFTASPRSDVHITYEKLVGNTVSWWVAGKWATLSEAYDNWVATREPPLFGTDPDTRVMAVAAEAGDPARCPVLDIGAGTGRNSLALARRGHPVDAVELSPKFAEIIGDEARQEGLSVRVIHRDVFETLDDLRTDYRVILLSEVVSDFRNTDQLRQLFELAGHCLAPGGYLVFNVFLPRDGFTPGDAARQLGQQCYTTIFTRSELAAAAAGLPLYQVADDLVHDYEKAHVPAESWPPTSWYVGWINGQDVFDVAEEDCPIGMRWMVYRKYS